MILSLTEWSSQSSFGGNNWTTSSDAQKKEKKDCGNIGQKYSLYMYLEYCIRVLALCYYKDISEGE